ncbi:hypothetical protein LUZ60_000519 [Juncus effusus]|nr:hypothetical protein LUZ60_000519 [Juncus effusus]
MATPSAPPPRTPPPPTTPNPPPPSSSPPPPASRSPPPSVPSPPPPSSSPPPSVPSPPPPSSSPPPSVPRPPPPSSSPPPSVPRPPPPSSSPPPSVPRPPPPSTSPPPPAPRPPLPSSSPPPSVPRPPPDSSLWSNPPPPPDSTLHSVPPSNSRAFPTAVVIGASVGTVVAAAALVTLLIICFYTRKREKTVVVRPVQQPDYRNDYENNPNQQPFDFEKLSPWSQTSPYELSPHAQKPLPLPPKMFGQTVTPTPATESSSSSGSHQFNHFSSQPSEAYSDISNGTTNFTYAQLLIATNGFSEKSLLGRGGFGDVYIGWIDENEVAIKRLRSGSYQGEREFKAEVEIISRVHHKNLVELVGFCISEEERMLVYEFVPNQTLHFHLHENTQSVLSWRQRWKIAMGSAKGLAYLHEQCNEKIIHRDIKAANILLDYDYNPKVADFGLAKFQPADQTHVSTRVMGTIGYIAPEFINSSKLTDKVDVFSYGVMLLELITGKPPVLPSRQTLVDWARPLLMEAMEESNYDHLIDPKLQSRFELNEMARLVKCASTAVRYTAEKRPTMNEIARQLEGNVTFEKWDTIRL